LIGYYYYSTASSSDLYRTAELRVQRTCSVATSLAQNMSLATFKTKLKTYLYPAFTITLEDHLVLLRRFRNSGASI